MLKTNPLLKMDSLGVNFLHDAGLSDVSERTEETVDSSPADSQSHKVLTYIYSFNLQTGFKNTLIIIHTIFSSRN